MKKILIIALGAIALVACTKTSVSYEQTGEIGFAPVARMNGTKATAIPTTAFPEAWNLKVYGYYDNTVTAGKGYSDGHFTEEYLPGVECAKNARGATAGFWLGKDHAYYWPKTGSILFAAYAPADYAAATVAHDKVNNTFSVTEMAQPTDFSKTVDLLYSPYSTSYNKTVVHMQFAHAFSWITLKAQSDAKISVKIKSIVLKGMAVKGKADVLPTWTVSGEQDLNVFTNADGTAVTDQLVEFADAKESVLLFPQTLGNNAVLEITYSMDRGDGTFIDQAPYSVVLNTLKSSKNVEINEWEAGKHYFYNVIFGAADEIQISPSVKEWDDVTAENISATKGGGE